MEVDLLSPGALPLSPDAILWFEFLLDQKLLKEHLQYPYSEPFATDLIVEFLSVDSSNSFCDGRPNDLDALPSPPMTSSREIHNITQKHLALKILALKIASTLKWNLDTFESKLTPLIQQQLVQDLVYMATDGAFSVPPQEIPICMVKKPHVQFALILYHRWILRFPVKAVLQAKSAKLPFIHIPSTPMEDGYTHISSSIEIKLRINETSRVQSIKYFEDVMAFYDSLETNNKEHKLIKIPVIETFVHPTEYADTMAHNWDAGSTYISHYELLMQIHFDLCLYYVFYRQHAKAKEHILGCRKNLTLLEHDIWNGYSPYDKVPWGKFNYASMSKEDIFGYIRALNLGHELLNEDRPLLQRLQESKANEYAGIMAILEADNLTREIPMIHRQVAELDIQASVLSGAVLVPKDLIIRVSALNAVRYALEGGLPSTHPDFLNKFKVIGIKFFDVLIWALAPVLLSTRLSEDDWDKLRMFFLHLATSSQCTLLIDRIDEYLIKHAGGFASAIRRKLIPDEHFEAIINDQINNEDENIYMPRELLADDWELPDFKYNSAPDFVYKASPELEMGRLKKRLLEASAADDVRICLVKLAAMSPSSPLWKLTPYSKPIGNLSSTLASLPRGFLQDFSVVVSGAVRARAEAGDLRVALRLLSAVESEMRNQLAGGSDPVLYRLCRTLAWEVLLLQVDLMLADWPHHRLNATLLASKCKAAISAANSSDATGPRCQVTLAAWICLLNLCEWETRSVPTLGLSACTSELLAALCAACAVLQRGKGVHKFPRTLWDYVLSTFSNASDYPKRSIHTNSLYHKHHGHHKNHTNHHGQLEHRSAFHAVLHALREPLAISVVLSLLARIYNVLVDDSSFDLVVEYANLWPNKIPDVNNYNPKYILETLTEVLERGLKLYPYNNSWLRLLGDLEMAGGRYGTGLRGYLCSLAVSSWHFTKRAPDEGSISRRAARCCQTLGASTQAAALFQLPDEGDYTPAFKCFAENTGNTADSMDAYYGCLWDGTLLEVAAAMHGRRGEGGRRARAVMASGTLELNANNSDDIRREAAAIRRARLLRALTDQYIS